MLDRGCLIHVPGYPLQQTNETMQQNSAYMQVARNSFSTLQFFYLKVTTTVYNCTVSSLHSGRGRGRKALLKVPVLVQNVRI